MAKTPNHKDKAPLARLRRAMGHGRGWSSCYWGETFAYDGLSINATAIPLYLLQLVEREELGRELLARLLACRSTPELGRVRAYAALWDEAVAFALGVREDARRAIVCADQAYAKAARGEWREAYVAARAAYLLEEQYATPRYWSGLLYAIDGVMIRLGYEHELRRFLRPYPPPAVRDSRARPGRHGGYQRS